jgi:hypothetical protein
MAITRDKANITRAASIRFDNSSAPVSVGSWKLVTPVLDHREYLTVHNQGVSMAGTTGVVCIFPSNDSTVTAISITNPQVTRLAPGTKFEGNYWASINLNVYAVTQNTVLTIEERDGGIIGGPYQSGTV